MFDLGAELLWAAEADIIGLALLDAQRVVQRKVGRMVTWLPEPGTDCCQCMLMAGMESELAALAARERPEIVLPGIRGAIAGDDQPITALVVWNSERQSYLVMATPDFTARQVETLLGSERRARRLMEQQLEAANSELRFASLARTRLRLARDLHDTLVHSIMALLTQIRLVQHFASSDPSRVSEGLATAEEAAISGLARARDVIARLRMPEELDSTAEVEEMLQDFARQTGAEVLMNIDEKARDGLRRCSVTVQRILSEALRNIESHAQAHRVEFSAEHVATAQGSHLIVQIRDDGIGFDPAKPRPGHFGLLGMAEFAELVGGACTVTSALGQGACVHVSLPLAT